MEENNAGTSAHNEPASSIIPHDHSKQQHGGSVTSSVPFTETPDQTDYSQRLDMDANLKSCIQELQMHKNLEWLLVGLWKYGKQGLALYVDKYTKNHDEVCQSIAEVDALKVTDPDKYQRLKWAAYHIWMDQKAKKQRMEEWQTEQYEIWVESLRDQLVVQQLIRQQLAKPDEEKKPKDNTE